jgi:hypothetical protein
MIEELEIWKPIQDCYDYEISNLGRVKNIKTGKYLKTSIRPDRYVNISLCVNNKTKNCKLHRLIAQAFIPNPENKPTVNHIDRNRSNNKLSNLEWATMSEQNKHSAKNQKSSYFCRPIIQKTIDNIYIQTFSSIKEASLWLFNKNLTKYNSLNELNQSIISSKICAVANGKRKNAYNFIWNYKDNNKYINNEIWKEIPYEIIGKYGYQVSNQGRIKDYKNIIKEKFSTSQEYIRLSINHKSYLLHRLIALTFLENPENKEHVNHKDGNKINNKLENLEWATCRENNIHKIETGLSNCKKKVNQYDKDMKYMNTFNSIKECAKANNITASCVSFNCLGLSKNPKIGYYFRYADE